MLLAATVDPTSPSLYMAESIMVGAGILIVTMAVQAFSSGLTVQIVGALVRNGYAGVSFFQNVASMMLVVLIALSGIMAQIAIWALVLYNLDEFPNFASAFYYSTNNFTTLGVDYVTTSARWRLLGPLEAVNGVLMFGVTTAMVYTIMGRLAMLRGRLTSVGNPFEDAGE
jgi:hypothetical protein